MTVENSEIPSDPAATAASPEPMGTESRSRIHVPKALFIALGAILLVALVSAGVMLAKKQLRKEDAPVAEAAPSPATIELPSEEAPARAATHAVEGPSPNKILNGGAASMKTAADVGEGLHAAPGAIDELPFPPPASAGNDALQNAAKEAAKRRRALQTGALTDYENSASAAVDNARLADEVAGLKQALQSELSTLTQTLNEERQRTADQAAEIERLGAEVERLKDPARSEGRAALLLEALADKARSGAPYRSELDAFRAARPETPIEAALASHADSGLPTAESLNRDFAPARDTALAAARREQANGPVARIGAGLAALVDLRPAKPMKGASATAVLSRAEAQADRGDIAGALAELEGLTGAARAAFAAWMEQAAAHVAAERALAATSASMIAALEGGATQ